MDGVWRARWIFTRRYLWRLLAFALAALGFAWLVTHSVTTTYKAEAQIAYKATEMPTKFSLESLLDNLLPLFMEDELYSVSYDVGSVLASETLTRRVLERNNLKERLYDPATMKPYPDWFEDFMGHLFFKIDKVQDTLTLAYAAETPELAEEITSLYADELEKYFVSLHYHGSLADAMQVVVDRRNKELADINQQINMQLVERGRIAVERSATQDIYNYLTAEKARLIAKTAYDGYQQALSNVHGKIDQSREGKEITPPKEVLKDYVLTFLKSVYYQEAQILAEKQTSYSADNPEVKFWKGAMGVTEELTRKSSGDSVESAYNTLVLRATDSKSMLDYWTERVANLKKTVEGLPQYEEDFLHLMRMQEYLKYFYWYWDRRLEWQRMGEELVDDPFIVLDGPEVPDKAYYPILKVWMYAFPVIWVVGTIGFLMRHKFELECVDDIVHKRLEEPLR